jgi:AraC-like DNA-binding protein
MRAPSPLVVETRSAEEAAEAIRAGFGYSVELSAGPLTYRQRVTAGEAVTASELHVGARLQLDLDPTDELMFVQVHGGTHRYDPWGVDRVLGPGSAFVMPPGRKMHFEIDHAHVSTYSFSIETFRETAREVFDLDDACVAEGAVEPRSRGQAWLWRRTAETYRDLILDDPESHGGSLLAAEATRFFVASTVSAFGLLAVPEQQASGNAAVRRAIAYIDDHLASPLTVHDIAAAARLSARGLLLAFQRERQQTPMQYVRAARLAAAREDLLTADPTRGDTVSDIAGRWGFGNVGRFAARYADTYGEAPRATLRR